MDHQLKKWTYTVDTGWPKFPDGLEHGQVTEVVVTGDGNVFVFHRADPSPLIFDSEGIYQGTWKPDSFWVDIHGVCHGLDAQGEYFIVVDRDHHTVSRTDLNGNVIWSMGTPDVPGAEGEPFNRPTNAAIGPNNEIYVTDGYENSRVHKVTSTGSLLKSWGEPGAGTSQFNLPHGLRVLDRDGDPTVYVCDRENNRIQMFTTEGDYLGKHDDLKRPANLVADSDGAKYIAEVGSRVTIFDSEDKVVGQLGTGTSQHSNVFGSPHTVAVDSRGRIYIGEVGEAPKVLRLNPA